MVSWNNLAANQRVDAIARAVQRICLLVVVAVELLLFLPGEAADNIVYGFLEWKLVDISILFLIASFCRKTLGQSKWLFLLGLGMVVWFSILRGIHLRTEGINQDPGAFVCAYLVCLPFAAAADDRHWGFKALAAVFVLTGASFGLYAVLLVAQRLPGFLAGEVFWDGPRFGVMGHPNICATVLMVSIGLTAGFALNTKRNLLKFPLLALAALEFWAICLTNSRTAIVLTCALLGGLAFCRLRRPNRKRILLALAAAAAIMVLLFCCSRWIYAWNNQRLTLLVQQAQSTGEDIGVALDSEGQLITHNAQSSFATSMKSLNGRTYIWKGAMKALRDHPRILLTGTEHTGEIISPYWVAPDIRHAHNAWLQTLFQLGIPGLLAALLLSALAVWNCVKLLWRNDDLMHACVAMVVLCLMGCAMLEPYLFTVNLQFHFFDFLFLLCLGYLNQWSSRKPNGGGEIEHV